jgi:hypothetical protein
MKSLKSRYALSQVNNQNFQEIQISGTKSESSLEAGYVWVPYIFSSSTGFAIESKHEMRKSKIQTIIDKL